MPSGLPNEVGLKIGAFTDMGSLFGIDNANSQDIYHSKKIRASGGLMLIWKSPLGTVNLSYGIPYRREKFDDAKRLNIDFGTKF
jgi:outer membrane protein insertion porin family